MAPFLCRHKHMVFGTVKSEGASWGLLLPSSRLARRGEHLGGCAHGLFAHLALVHVARGLVEVRVGRLGCHHTQHGIAADLPVAVQALIACVLRPIRTPAAHQGFVFAEWQPISRAGNPSLLSEGSTQFSDISHSGAFNSCKMYKVHARNQPCPPQLTLY